MPNDSTTKTLLCKVILTPAGCQHLKLPPSSRVCPQRCLNPEVRLAAGNLLIVSRTPRACRRYCASASRPRHPASRSGGAALPPSRIRWTRAAAGESSRPPRRADTRVAHRRRSRSQPRNWPASARSAAAFTVTGVTRASSASRVHASSCFTSGIAGFLDQCRQRGRWATSRRRLEVPYVRLNAGAFPSLVGLGL